VGSFFESVRPHLHIDDIDLYQSRFVFRMKGKTAPRPILRKPYQSLTCDSDILPSCPKKKIPLEPAPPADGSVKIIREVAGKAGGRAAYEQTIDGATELTKSVVQNAYDAAGNLVHVDPKFP